MRDNNGTLVMKTFSHSRWLSQACAVLFAVILYQGSQWVARDIHLAPALFPGMAKRYLWIRYDEHHLWQMLFALLCIGILSRGRFSQWGFNLNNVALSRRLLLGFCAVCTLVVIALVILPAWITHESSSGLITPTTRANTIGWLVFEWMFVGISEEILFRGLIQTFLQRSFPGVWKVLRVPIPHAGLLTTILFCLAHVPNWRHPQVAIDQQIIVFCLSLYASIAYYRTRSLFAPILAHNFNDGLFVTAQTICFRLLH
jgi:membrane protease YdiL (CAAX protease family)